MRYPQMRRRRSLGASVSLNGPIGVLTCHRPTRPRTKAPKPTTPKKKYTLGGLGKPTVRQGSPSKGREFSITSHGSDEEIVESEPEAEPRVTKFLPLFLDDSDEEQSVAPREETVESDDEWDDSEAILHVCVYSARCDGYM